MTFFTNQKGPKTEFLLQSTLTFKALTLYYSLDDR